MSKTVKHIFHQVSDQVDEDIFTQVWIKLKSRVIDQILDQVDEQTTGSVIRKVRSRVERQVHHVRDLILLDEKLYE